MFRALRRFWQVSFLLLFLALVVVASARLLRNWQVEWFLQLDPLVALTTALATRSLEPGLLWAVPLVVLTLVFGRFFCGWMCPAGTLHQAVSWLVRPKSVRARIAQNAPHPWRRAKYFVLFAMLGMAALGSVQIGLLDPIASLWRGLAVLALPAAGNPIPYLPERHFQYALFAGVVFLGGLALNLAAPRFFCRVLCPLGALLGLVSRLAVFRVGRRAARCKDCDVCGADCQGAADPAGKVLATECMACLNCTGGCPRAAMAYEFLPAEESSETKIDPGRRRWLGALVGGAALVPLARASAGASPRPDPRRIRPPGALDEKRFLERCIKCGACMKACPTGGLQPAMGEAGLEGLWTPVLVPRLGHCESACVVCTRVCPTGALRPLTVEEKVGRAPEPPQRIGSAAIDRGRCLPWASDTPCIVCEEVCPTAPKAIWFRLETVVARDGAERTLKRPYVDLSRCTGCGVCEARCPVFDQAAIRTSSVGETRDPKNRIILGS